MQARPRALFNFYVQAIYDKNQNGGGGENGPATAFSKESELGPLSWPHAQTPTPERRGLGASGNNRALTSTETRSGQHTSVGPTLQFKTEKDVLS